MQPSARGRSFAWCGFAAPAFALSIVLDGGLVPASVPVWRVASTLAIQTGAIALNTAMVVQRIP